MDVNRDREGIEKYIGQIKGRLEEEASLLKLYGGLSLPPARVIGAMPAEVDTKRTLAWLMTRLSDDVDLVTPQLQTFGDYLQITADCADDPQPVFAFDRLKLESDAASLRTMARKLRRMTDTMDVSTVNELWRTSRTAHSFVLEVLKANELLQTSAREILPDASNEQEG